MRFTINLATRTYLDNRLLNRIGFFALAILLAILGWNIFRVSSNMGELSRMNAEIVVLQNRLDKKPGGVSEADVKNQRNRIRLYNEIIERKSKNWLNLLDLFENVTPAGISLSTLAPDKTGDEWKIEGHARTFAAVQLYLEKLEGSKNFSHVLLLSHQNIIAGENNRGIHFSISCKVLN